MEPAHSKVISSLTQGLLLEEQEDSVQQLEVLGKVVQLDSMLAIMRPGAQTLGTGSPTHVVQSDQWRGPTSTSIANGVEDSVTGDSRN